MIQHDAKRVSPAAHAGDAYFGNARRWVGDTSFQLASFVTIKNEAFVGW